MTEKQLMNMQQLLRAAEVDSDLTMEEVKDLQLAVKNELYALRIKNFKQHLDDMMPKADSSNEEWDKFYDHDWSISFGGKTVHIHNEATIYNSMCDALDEYIDECL